MASCKTGNTCLTSGEGQYALRHSDVHECDVKSEFSFMTRQLHPLNPPLLEVLRHWQFVSEPPSSRMIVSVMSRKDCKMSNKAMSFNTAIHHLCATIFPINCMMRLLATVTESVMFTHTIWHWNKAARQQFNALSQNMPASLTNPNNAAERCVALQLHTFFTPRPLDLYPLNRPKADLVV
jgi:hypothetical protein